MFVIKYVNYGLVEVYSVETGLVVMSDFESAEAAWQYVFDNGGASKLQARWQRA